MDRLFALETFIKTVDYKGFSAAAWQLDVSPATLTKTIQALEEELGFKLFHRTTRQVSLTDQGKAYYPLAKDILTRFKDSKRIKNESFEQIGTIRIAVPNLIAYCFLVDIFNKFLGEHPKISIELIHYGAGALVSNNDADIAFTNYKTLDTKLNYKLLFSEPRKLVAAPKYIAKNGMPTSVKDLVNYDCLVNTTLHPEGVWEFGKEKIQVNARLKTADSLYLIKAAVAGLGILLALPIFIQQKLKDGELAILPIEYEEKATNIYLCYPSLPKGDKTRMLVEFLIKEINITSA